MAGRRRGPSDGVKSWLLVEPQLLLLLLHEHQPLFLQHYHHWLQKSSLILAR
jgi:hypothetical protein